MVLTREQLESGVANMVKVMEVPLPELVGSAWIRILPATVRDAYDQSRFTEDGKPIADNISGRLVCLCLCDEDGEPLYPDVVEGAAIIAKWPTPVVERLFIAARTFNLMGTNDLEQAAKNYEPDPDSSSSID